MSVKQLDPRMTQEWDLFSSDVVDETTTYREDVRYPYTTSGTSTGVPTSEILIRVNDKSSWLLINEAYLEVKCSITQSNGTALTTTAGVATAGHVAALTNGGWHLFERVKWSIDNKTVSDVTSVGVAANVMNLVCWSEDNLRSLGSRTGFYREAYTGADVEIKEFNDNGTELTERNSKYSESFKIRADKNLASATHTLLLPIADVCRFWNNRHGTATIDDLRIKVDELNLWIPQLQASLSVQTMLDKQLAAGATKTVVYNDLFVIQSSPMSGSGRQRFLLSSNLRKPKRVYVVFQDNARLSGTRQAVQNINKAVYDTLNMQNMRLMVNGKPVPKTEYAPFFHASNENYIRLYRSFLQAGRHCNDTESGSIVTYEDFKNIYPIFVFDCGYSKGDRAAFSYETAADMVLEFTPGATIGTHALPTSYVVLAVVEAEAELDYKGDGERLQILCDRR